MHSSSFRLVFILGAYLPLTNAFPSWTNTHQAPFSGEVQTGKGTRDGLIEADIIPDVLDDFEPAVEIVLSYPSKHKSVSLGNILKPKAVKSEPVFAIHASGTIPTRTLNSNTTYTLVLTDPDATSRSEPVKAQMCHWIATNISLPSFSSDIGGALSPLALGAKSGGSGIQELMSYFPPAPPPGTGHHRYVFVLLAPVDKTANPTDLRKPKDRPHWGYGKIGAGVREWAEENDLVAVGANFFYSQNKKQ